MTGQRVPGPALGVPDAPAHPTALAAVAFHPLRDEARAFFLEQLEGGGALVTSTEVLQELVHAYLPVGRLEMLDAALALARERVVQVWAVEAEDVVTARDLMSSNPSLGARDLLHLACCARRGVKRIRTFDRALAAAFA